MPVIYMDRASIDSLTEKDIRKIIDENKRFYIAVHTAERFDNSVPAFTGQRDFLVMQKRISLPLRHMQKMIMDKHHTLLTVRPAGSPYPLFPFCLEIFYIHLSLPTFSTDIFHFSPAVTVKSICTYLTIWDLLSVPLDKIRPVKPFPFLTRFVIFTRQSASS